MMQDSEVKNAAVRILHRAFIFKEAGLTIDSEIVITDVKEMNLPVEEGKILINFMASVASVVLNAEHKDINIVRFDISRVACDLEVQRNNIGPANDTQ